METTKLKILSGQSWKAGQFLFHDTSGLLKTCASDADSGTGGVKYVALTDQADPGNSTTYAEVGVIHQDHVFEMNELNGTVSEANLGVFYAIDVTSNIVTIDVDDTGNDALVVTELGYDYNPLQNTSSDTLARVRVKVIPAAIEAAPA